MSDSAADLLRERLLASTGTHLTDADALKLLTEVLNFGGGVSIDLGETRFKLIRRDGRFVLKKDDARVRSSTLPPRIPRG